METNKPFFYFDDKEYERADDQDMVVATVERWREGIQILNYKLGYPHIAKAVRDFIDSNQNLEPEYEEREVAVLVPAADYDEISLAIKKTLI